MRPIYDDKFLSELSSDFLFNSLLALDWLDLTEARRELFMSDIPRSYTYGKGVGEREYVSAAMDPAVATVQIFLNRYGSSYNVCFLNRYDDKSKQLGWHADDSPSMDQGHPIAVLSLGAEREIWWREQGASGIVPAENRQRLAQGQKLGRA